MFRSTRKGMPRLAFAGVFIMSVAAISLIGLQFTYAYNTDAGVYVAPDYQSFRPPAAGGSYTDPVFGAAIKRLTNAMTMNNADGGGMLTTAGPEYSTMSPFNMDNTLLLVQHRNYFGLYDGAGNFLKELPFEVNSSSQPRWSRTDPNVLYYIRGNQLKQFNVGTLAYSVVHAFSEYGGISGNFESDICFDGNHFVLAGDGRFIFVYDIQTNTKGNVFDTGGRGFDSIYITPDDHVTITWLANGSSRFTGIEMFDKNMNFLRQLTHAGGHMDVTRDSNGEEVLVWAAGADNALRVSCDAGVVKVRLSDGAQTCIWKGNWNLAVHVSTPDNSGWAFIETYAPGDPIPPSNWHPYTNEILQVRLDGSEVRRLAHHRSRPFNSYLWTPRLSSSRDGSKLIFASNFGLQAMNGYPSDYSDAYFIDVSTSSPGSSGPPSEPSTPTTPPPTPSEPTPSVPAVEPAPAPAVEPGKRVEQDSSGITYSGTWHRNSYGFHSAAGAVLAMDSGARATLNFNGTGAKFIGYQDEWSGIAKVYVDNNLVVELDTYASPARSQSVLYTVSNLAPGNHSLTIEVTGQKGSRSGGAWVWIDAFEVFNEASSTSGQNTIPNETKDPAVAEAAPPSQNEAAPPGVALRVDDNSLQYSGLWYPNGYPFHTESSAKLAMTPDASVTLRFTGTAVSWIAYRDEWSGVAQVYIDGVLQGEVDTYASQSTPQSEIWAAVLDWGTHTITIRPSGRKNPASGGAWIWIDAFYYR